MIKHNQTIRRQIADEGLTLILKKRGFLQKKIKMHESFFSF